MTQQQTISTVKINGHTVTLSKRNGSWRLMCWQCDRWLEGSWHYKTEAMVEQAAHKAATR